MFILHCPCEVRHIDFIENPQAFINIMHSVKIMYFSLKKDLKLPRNCTDKERPLEQNCKFVSICMCW